MNWRITSLMVLLIAPWLQGCIDDPDRPNYVRFSSAETGVYDYSEYRICIDVNDHIYLSQNILEDDVYRYHYFDGEQWNQGDLIRQYEHRRYSQMAASPDGSVWVLAWDQLYQLKNGLIVGQRLIPPTPTGALLYAFEQMAYDNGKLWLLHATEGLYAYDIATGQLARYPDGSGAEYYRLLAVDGLSNKWVSTNSVQYPLFRIDASGGWLPVQDPDSVLNCPGCPGAYHDSDPFRQMIVNSRNEVLMNRWSQLCSIKDGIYSYQPFHWGFTSNSYPIYTRMSVDRNDALWAYRSILQSEAHLVRINNGVLSIEADLTKAVTSGNVNPYDIAFDRKGNVWSATDNGVVVYNKEGIRF